MQPLRLYLLLRRDLRSISSRPRAGIKALGSGISSTPVTWSLR